jgi:ribonucleoside-diphosphate reductase alpha chain
MFDSVQADEDTFDSRLIKSLNRLDFKGAQESLLGLINEQVGRKRSWDSPQYATSRKVQENIVLDVNRNERLTFFALDTLRDRYFLRGRDGVICESPQDFWARVATGVACGGHTVDEVDLDMKLFRETMSFAQELYDILSQLHALFATPILTNAGTNRGKLISCFLNEADDSIVDIYDTYRENAVLAQGGGGIGTYFGGLRSEGAKLSRGGKSSGPLPFLKVMDSSTIAVHQAGARRGAAAAYMDISHPDIEDFIDMRRPEGAEERRCQNIHHGVCVTDDFMNAMEARGTWDLKDPNTGKVVKTVDAYSLWKRINVTRVMTGEPYILNIDTVNRLQPATYRKIKKKVRTSNLCIEITLPTRPGPVKKGGLTAICDLASKNLARYEEWKGYAKRLSYCMVKGLDNVLDHFITFSGPEYDKAVASAKAGRDIGLGVMGWFDYLQQRGIPAETILARSHNKTIFKEFGELSDEASRQLALERGPAPDALRASGLFARLAVTLVVALGLNKTAMGRWFIQKVVPKEYLFRNVNRQALAPTATIGIIAGASPSIEPMAGNVFNQKTLSGTFMVQNGALAHLMATKYSYKDNQDTWLSIMENGGSVQHFDWMEEEDKKVFKTAYELNQRELIQQAADRQKWISQAQSLNVFFAPNAEGKISASYLHDVHLLAWKKGVKSLYYCRSESVLRASTVDAKSDVSDRAKIQRVMDAVTYEICAVCQ